MTLFAAPGKFNDRWGTEDVVWEFVPYSGGSRRMPSFTVRACVRGVPVSGFDVEGLGIDAELPPDAQLDAGADGYLDGYTVSGRLPISVRFAGRLSQTELGFEVSVPPSLPPLRTAPNSTLSLTLDGVRYLARAEWFEDCFVALLSKLPNACEVECCWTCLYSDVSPGEYSGMAMACHRGVKEQYLAVRSKADYWKVPVTEEVPQTYRCPEWTERVPGTGYRG